MAILMRVLVILKIFYVEIFYSLKLSAPPLMIIDVMVMPYCFSFCRFAAAAAANEAPSLLSSLSDGKRKMDR